MEQAVDSNLGNYNQAMEANKSESPIMEEHEFSLNMRCNMYNMIYKILCHYILHDVFILYTEKA